MTSNMKAKKSTYRLRIVTNGARPKTRTIVVNETRLHHLTAALEIFNSDEGCTTPIEHFINKLVHLHTVRPYTISTIQELLNEAREELRDLRNAHAA